MKNLPTILSTLAAALAVSLLPAMAGAQSVNERQHNQKERIARGIRGEGLTKKESAGQQARIRAFELKNRRDGEGYSKKERARTQRRENEASKDIFRKKHNDKDRG